MEPLTIPQLPSPFDELRIDVVPPDSEQGKDTLGISVDPFAPGSTSPLSVRSEFASPWGDSPSSAFPSPLTPSMASSFENISIQSPTVPAPEAWATYSPSQERSLLLDNEKPQTESTYPSQPNFGQNPHVSVKSAAPSPALSEISLIPEDAFYRTDFFQSSFGPSGDPFAMALISQDTPEAQSYPESQNIPTTRAHRASVSLGNNSDFLPQSSRSGSDSRGSPYKRHHIDLLTVPAPGLHRRTTTACAQASRPMAAGVTRNKTYTATRHTPSPSWSPSQLISAQGPLPPGVYVNPAETTSNQLLVKPKVGSESLMNAAVSRRTNPAKFSCSVEGCESTFTALHNLKNHMNSHSGEKPYSCEYCRQAFTTKAVKNRHAERCSSRPADEPVPPKRIRRAAHR